MGPDGTAQMELDWPIRGVKMHTIYLNSDVAEPLNINELKERRKTIYETPFSQAAII